MEAPIETMAYYVALTVKFDHFRQGGKRRSPWGFISRLFHPQHDHAAVCVREGDKLFKERLDTMRRNRLTGGPSWSRWFALARREIFLELKMPSLFDTVTN